MKNLSVTVIRRCSSACETVSRVNEVVLLFIVVCYNLACGTSESAARKSSGIVTGRRSSPATVTYVTTPSKHGSPFTVPTYVTSNDVVPHLDTAHETTIRSKNFALLLKFHVELAATQQFRPKSHVHCAPRAASIQASNAASAYTGYDPLNTTPCPSVSLNRTTIVDACDMVETPRRLERFGRRRLMSPVYRASSSTRAVRRTRRGRRGRARGTSFGRVRSRTRSGAARRSSSAVRRDVTRRGRDDGCCSPRRAGRGSRRSTGGASGWVTLRRLMF